MAQTKENWTVGEAVRKSSLQRMSDAAGTADDRALEILATPGSTLKKILPLSEESATLNPRILVAGKDTDATIANGVVRVRPAHFIAGASANAIGLSAKLAANLDSPVFGNNSSGATRYDLLYASISYGTATAESVRQKPLSGGDPISVNINTQLAPLVTLNVVAGVASGNPLASLPADTGGVYNFGLAMVALANGFAGGAINQASITPLWEGGWIGLQRIRRAVPASIYSGSDNEKPTNAVSDRVGAGYEMFGHFKVLGTTPTAIPGVVLDNTIDWRRRLILVTFAYIGNASVSDLATATPVIFESSTFSVMLNPGDQTAVSGGTVYAGTSSMHIYVDSSGVLRFFVENGPAGGANGDLIGVFVKATDQFKVGG